MSEQHGGQARSVRVMDERGGFRTVRVSRPAGGQGPSRAYLDDGTPLLDVGCGCYRIDGTARVFIALQYDGG